MSTSEDSLLDERITLARKILRESRYVVAFTGAGISTPSGVPDFRSAGSGLWERFNPLEVASLSVFLANPIKFWDWKRPLLRQMWTAQPNDAHWALAEMERLGILRAVITQNIDGLHQRAGSQIVLELHGSIDHLECLECHATFPMENFRELLETSESMPRCPKDSSVLKPTIVLYEEMLPDDVWMEAMEHTRKADCMLVIGSSLEVFPASELPLQAVSQGAHLIINNFSPTRLDHLATVLLPWDVCKVLPLLVS